MNIYLCGQKAFGAAAFRTIRDAGHVVNGVSSPLHNARGDGPDRLFEAAQTFAVPWIPAGDLRAETLPADTDLIVAAHSHDFIGAATRRKSRYGAIGYHPSLLPRHRGRDAVRWAVKMREPVTGGTIYWLDGVMDGGPIATQEWCWIRPSDSAEELWRRELFPMGLRLLANVLADVPGYFARRTRQDESLATFEPACRPPRAYRPDLLMLPAPVANGYPGYAWRCGAGMRPAMQES